ncbi:hypothetical protein TNCV_3189401 [Trichonephila clavipes]|nr:hypothetical protein TNCV_3189401 [Trichonephila clavipes]
MVSDRGPRNSSWHRARLLRLSLSVALSTLQVTVRDLARFYPSFKGRWGWSKASNLSTPSTSLTRGLAARRLLRVPPMPRRHYTFTNIHAISGIRTRALQHSSQRH